MSGAWCPRASVNALGLGHATPQPRPSVGRVTGGETLGPYPAGGNYGADLSLPLHSSASLASASSS